MEHLEHVIKRGETPWMVAKWWVKSHRFRDLLTYNGLAIAGQVQWKRWHWLPGRRLAIPPAWLEERFPNVVAARGGAAALVASSAVREARRLRRLLARYGTRGRRGARAVPSPLYEAARAPKRPPALLGLSPLASAVLRAPRPPRVIPVLARTAPVRTVPFRVDLRPGFTGEFTAIAWAPLALARLFVYRPDGSGLMMAPECQAVLVEAFEVGGRPEVQAFGVHYPSEVRRLNVGPYSLGKYAPDWIDGDGPHWLGSQRQDLQPLVLVRMGERIRLVLKNTSEVLPFSCVLELVGTETGGV